MHVKEEEIFNEKLAEYIKDFLDTNEWGQLSIKEGWDGALVAFLKKNLVMQHRLGVPFGIKIWASLAEDIKQGNI